MEVAVIDGGVVGCAAAALLAEAGARVTLFERDRIAAGASGRNQGVLQNPLDEVLTPLYEESLRLHAETAPALGLDRPPDGLLLVSFDPGGPSAIAERIGRTYPRLAPVFLEDAGVLRRDRRPGDHGRRDLPRRRARPRRGGSVSARASGALPPGPCGRRARRQPRLRPAGVARRLPARRRLPGDDRCWVATGNGPGGCRADRPPRAWRSTRCLGAHRCRSRSTRGGSPPRVVDRCSVRG